MVARQAHNLKAVGSNPTSRNYLWFAKELSMYANTCVGTALTAGFMSLNKLGDRYKALFVAMGNATFNPWVESLMENQHS